VERRGPRKRPSPFRATVFPMRTVFAGLVAVVVAATAQAGAAGGPSVALLRARPVTLAGTGYRPGAHLIVSYRSGATSVRRSVTASAAGRFGLVLPGVRFRRCDGVTLVAGAAQLRVDACSAGGRPLLTADPGGRVAGTAFVPGERVVVTARPSGGDTVTRAVTATARGTFVASVAVPAHACAEVTYRATGSLGSTAAYVTPAPDCMAP